MTTAAPPRSVWAGRWGRAMRWTPQAETYAAVARALGRRHSSIKGRLMTLARHDERGTA